MSEHLCILKMSPAVKDVKTLSEHHRSSNVRSYQMRKRADDMAQTRKRIIEAAVRLHGTVGPAATTISALAEEAGVTRLTVYRHFPDEIALFGACSSHWASGQDLPHPDAWGTVEDPVRRVRVGLTDLYRFYREAEPMLANVRRDRAWLPPEVQQRTAATEEGYRDTLLKAFRVRGKRRDRLRSVLGHAVSFWTWRSLCLDQRLTNPEAAQAMSDLILATAGLVRPAPPLPTTRRR
jgi:AcrR family transcriptional regulator